MLDLTASKKSSVVSLLDAKKSNNTSIMLSQVPLTSNEIREEIYNLNVSNKLTPEQIIQVYKLLPTKEEMDPLMDYHGDVSSLGKPEQFFLELIKIPRLPERLQVCNVIVIITAVYILQVNI